MEELKEIYKSYSLHKHTSNTITTLDKLNIELRKIRQIGYSLNEAETFDYVYGVGAAILDSQGRAIAAISLSGTKGSINIKTIPNLAKKVIETSLKISSKLSEDH
jgi:IclR family acetate operon transcriptional repressor